MMKLFNFILDILIPPVCPICHESVDVIHTLCPTCFSELKFITKPCCDICGYPFEFDIEGERTCGRCLKDPPHFHSARSLLVYNDGAKNLVLPFKHADRLDLAPLFTKLMYQNYKSYIDNNDVIVPVPLHFSRLIKRKYNQAAILAQLLAKKVNKQYLPNTLKRIKATPSQGHKSATERKENIKGAFRIKNPKMILGKRVLLIDDVMTTGATVNECAKVLMKSGAKEVNVLTICRVAND